MKKSQGFTLIELIIVIVIVGIISIVTVSVYRGHTKKAMAMEGVKLLEVVRDSVDVFNSISTATFTNNVGPVASFDFGSLTGTVDASTNRYFRTFSVKSNGSGSYTATAFNAVYTGRDVVLTWGDANEVNNSISILDPGGAPIVLR